MAASVFTKADVHSHQRTSDVVLQALSAGPDILESDGQYLFLSCFVAAWSLFACSGPRHLVFRRAQPGFLFRVK